MSDPGENRLSGGLRNLELYWPMGLLLHDDRSSGDSIAVGDVANSQLHEVAAAQLAADRQVEERQLALSICQFEPNANGPNFAKLERRLLADQLALVPGSTRPESMEDANIMNSCVALRSSEREIHAASGIATGRHIAN